MTASGDGGKGSVGTMTLVIDTTGKPGPTLVIDSIAGNPVLSPGELGVFNANLTITGDQPSAARAGPGQAEPVRRARVRRVRQLRGVRAQRARRRGARPVHAPAWARPRPLNAITYAKASCGFLTSIGGGEG